MMFLRPMRSRFSIAVRSRMNEQATCWRNTSLGTFSLDRPCDLPAQPWSRRKRSSMRSSMGSGQAASFSTEMTLSPGWRSNRPSKIMLATANMVGAKPSVKSAKALSVRRNDSVLAATCRLIGMLCAAAALHSGSKSGWL